MGLLWVCCGFVVGLVLGFGRGCIFQEVNPVFLFSISLHGLLFPSLAFDLT